MGVLDAPPAPYAPAIVTPVRYPITGRVLFVENATPHLRQGGMFNDGCGSASPDYNVLFNGYPTLRLDPQGNTTSSSTNSQQLNPTLQTVCAAYCAAFGTILRDSSMQSSF